MHRFGLRLITFQFLAGIVILCMTGCGMRIASTADRKATLASYGKSKFGSQSMRRHLTERSGLVIADPLLVLPDRLASDDPYRLGVLSFASSNSVAAAIDRRGYFLTTSHSVGKATQDIAFRKGDRIQVVPARVVWRGRLSKHEPDLAVLHVPSRLDHVFEWAPLSERPPVVFAAGLESEGARHRLDYISGSLQRILSQDNPNKPPTDSILHNAPLHRGDSGGPLTNSEGQLLGVNVLVRLSILQPTPIGIAERPNLDWLRTVIEQDQRKEYR